MPITPNVLAASASIVAAMALEKNNPAGDTQRTILSSPVNHDAEDMMDTLTERTNHLVESDVIASIGSDGSNVLTETASDSVGSLDLMKHHS